MVVPSNNAGRSDRGFTLIEMLVTVAIIAMGMTLVMGYGEIMLPQTQLQATVSELSVDLQSMRNHALLTQREVVFTYHLDEETYSAFYPLELDDEGKVVGPGETFLLDKKQLRGGMDIVHVELADGSKRPDGDVMIHISRLGRTPPHTVYVENPEYREYERRWVEVKGLVNDYEILEERSDDRLVMVDASFR